MTFSQKPQKNSMPPPTNLAIWPASTVSRLSASRPRCGGASSPRCDERRYGDVGCSGAAVAQRRSGTDVDVEQKDHKHRHLGFSKCGDWDSFSPGYKVDVVSYIYIVYTGMTYCAQNIWNHNLYVQGLVETP